MDAKENERSRWFRQVVCSCVAVLLCFLFLEIGLRARQYAMYGTWAVPGWLRTAKQDTSMWHPFLRTVPRPSVVRTEVQNGTSVVIRTSSLGLRSGEVSEQKPAGVFRILCVGGSVVYDTRVAFSESWPNQLQSLLRTAYPQARIEVLNAGMPGRTSADSLVNVGLRLLALAPDVVIVMHGVNDQKPNRYPGFKPDYSHWYQRLSEGSLLSPLNRAVDYSLFGTHIRYRLTYLLNPYLYENWRGEPMQRYDEVTQPGLDAYRRNLESIIAMCQRQGATVVVASIGHSVDENVDWNRRMGTRNPLVYYHDGLTLKGIRHAFVEYNRINREVAMSGKCIFVDMEKRLPEGKRNFQDDVHFTAEGSRQAARLFLEDVPWDTLIVK